jgi:hypothetical protein
MSEPARLSTYIDPSWPTKMTKLRRLQNELHAVSSC